MLLRTRLVGYDTHVCCRVHFSARLSSIWTSRKATNFGLIPGYIRAVTWDRPTYVAVLLFVMNFHSSVLLIASISSGLDASMLRTTLRIRQNVFRATLSIHYAYIFRASHSSCRTQLRCVHLSTWPLPFRHSILNNTLCYYKCFRKPFRYYILSMIYFKRLFGILS